MESTLGANCGTADDTTAQASQMQATHVLHTPPPTPFGILGKVPLEVRSQIYDYLFSPNCYSMTTDPEACLARPNHLNILMTSQAVRSEAIHYLASKSFTLGCYIAHDQKMLVKNDKIDIPNVFLRNVFKHMRSIQITLDVPFVCGYVDRRAYWRAFMRPPTVSDWPSIAQNNSAPATSLLLALPSILAGAAENHHGGDATIVLRGSYREFRYPVTTQGRQAFRNLVAVFRKFETLKLRAGATVNLPYGSTPYGRLSEKSQARVARALKQCMKVLMKNIKDVVGPNKWTEDGPEESGGLKSGTAEFHPLAHLAAPPLPNKKTRRNNRRKKSRRERNQGICQLMGGT